MYTDAIQRLYVAYFNRPADPVSLATYEDILQARLNGQPATQADLETLAAQFFSPSAEYSALYNGLTNAQIVNQLYNNLFGRDAEAAGLTAWTRALNEGTETFASIALQLTFSAQGTDAQTIEVRLNAATAFTAAVDTAAEILGYSGNDAAASARTWLAQYDFNDIASGSTADAFAPAAGDVTTGVTTVVAAGDAASNVGQTLSLTTGKDALVGGAGNDTINAVWSVGADNTITAFDSADGAGGTDTLSITATQALADTNFSAIGASFSNIENVNISSTAAVAFDETDLSGSALTVTGTTGAVDVESTTFTSATVSTTGAVTLTDNNAAGKDVLASVTVAKSTGAIGVTSDALTTLNLNATTGAATVTAAAGARALTVNTSGTTTSNVTDATATSLTLNAGGALTSTVTAGAATELTVAAAAATTLTNGGLDELKTLTASGAGNVSADVSGAAKLATISAGAATGKITTTIAATATAVTTGSGADSVTQAAALGATQKIDTGAGDDVVSLTAASALTKGATVDGGAGTDTLVIDDAVANAAANGVEELVFANFEKISVTDVGANSTVDLNAFDDINYYIQGGIAGAFTLAVSNFESGGTFEQTAVLLNAGADVTLGVTNANISSTDVMNLKLTSNGAMANLGDITIADVETINIESDDTLDNNGVMVAHTVILAADAVKSIAVTGDAGLTLTYTGTTVTSVDASGMTVDTKDATPAGFTWTSGAIAAAIDVKGSAAGPNTVDLSAATKAITYTGGTGVDIVTGNNSANTFNTGAGNDQITGGTGVDTIDAGAGNDTITAGTGLDIVTGGAGNDTFVIAAEASGTIYTSITDASKGDILSFANQGTETFTTAAITLGGNAVFQDYLDAATAGDGSTNGIIRWFQFGGNTYVVQDKADGATFTNGIDIVVELQGLVNLATATLDAGANTLTLA